MQAACNFRNDDEVPARRRVGIDESWTKLMIWKAGLSGPTILLSNRCDPRARYWTRCERIMVVRVHTHNADLIPVHSAVQAPALPRVLIALGKAGNDDRPSLLGVRERSLLGAKKWIARASRDDEHHKRSKQTSGQTVFGRPYLAGRGVPGETAEAFILRDTEGGSTRSRPP